MKTSLATLLGLLVAGAALAQPTAPPLVTVTPNPMLAPSPSVAPSQPAAPGFTLKPIGIVKEVLKLTESGADSAVIKAFVQSWPTRYSVTADDILRLHQAGVSSDTLTALIQRGAELSGQAPGAMTAPQLPPGVSDMTPAPTYPTEVPVPTSPAPDVYNYGYPQYEPYYSTPAYTYPYVYGVGPSFYVVPSVGFYGRYGGYYHRGFYQPGFAGRSFAGRSFGGGGRSFSHSGGFSGHSSFGHSGGR